MTADGFLERFEALLQEERKKYLRQVDPELRRTFRDIPLRVVAGDENGRLYADYHGTPYPQEHPFAPYAHPSDITFYAVSFRPFSEDEKKLREMIRMVLIHEYGHYLGFTEKQLRKKGL
jgi:predicted Zn-dependent protease with MMP-like domain